MGKLIIAWITLLSIVVITAIHRHKDIVNKINKSKSFWKAEDNYITRRGNWYAKKLLGTILTKSNQNIKKTVTNDNIPDEFDSRSQWPDCPSISAIKDQGACGSCWAVAAASAASDRLCVWTNSQTALNLSAQNIMSCCIFCSFIGGCNGGYPAQAWAYIKFFGVVTGGDYDSNEGCQPYEIPPSHPQNSTTFTTNEFIPTPFCHWTCTNDQYLKKYLGDKRRAKTFYTVASSVSSIQTEILTYGPVEASFNVYQDFMYYKSGVYIQSSSENLGGHSVKLVGWGTDPVSQVPYWLAANSWNTSWGDKGWFKIRRGTNECGIEEYVTAGTF